jgi:rhodanese-related sulfurtransferase
MRTGPALTAWRGAARCVLIASTALLATGGAQAASLVRSVHIPRGWGSPANESRVIWNRLFWACLQSCGRPLDRPPALEWKGTAMSSAADTSTSPKGSTSPVTAGSIAEAHPKEVQQWLRIGSAVLIDVREPDEHARERIQGARLLPLSRFDLNQAAAWSKPGQTIALHCRSGRRSADACRLAASLASRGTRVVNMTGGIEAWKSESLPVETDTWIAGLSVMRQVQLVIGVGLIAGSVLAWLVHPAFIAVPAFLGAGLTLAGATGTCALAAIIGRMPWNKAGAGHGSCTTGSCV